MVESARPIICPAPYQVLNSSNPKTVNPELDCSIGIPSQPESVFAEHACVAAVSGIRGHHACMALTSHDTAWGLIARRCQLAVARAEGHFGVERVDASLPYAPSQDAGAVEVMMNGELRPARVLPARCRRAPSPSEPARTRPPPSRCSAS